MRLIHTLITLALIVPSLATTSNTATQSNKVSPRYFVETNHAIAGKFLFYWQQHGGLSQQGYPISDEFQEVSDLDGKTYTVQYFERAVFEMHPENPPIYRVLLSQVGTFHAKYKYPAGLPQKLDDVNCADFATQEDAQRFYVAAGGPAKDPYHLDSNRNGVACEGNFKPY